VDEAVDAYANGETKTIESSAPEWSVLLLYLTDTVAGNCYAGVLEKKHYHDIRGKERSITRYVMSVIVLMCVCVWCVWCVQCVCVCGVCLYVCWFFRLVLLLCVCVCVCVCVRVGVSVYISFQLTIK